MADDDLHSAIQAVKLCTCGHPFNDHPLYRSICTTCGYTHMRSGQVVPNGFCMGWPYPLAEQSAIEELEDSLVEQNRTIAKLEVRAQRTEGELHATRDRHAALEVQVAELRDLLEQMATEHLFDQEASIDWDWLHEMKRKVLAVLQISGPDRGHTILQEVQRLRVALAAARWWMVEHGLPLTDGHAVLIRSVSSVDVDEALALDQAAQRETP